MLKKTIKAIFNCLFIFVNNIYLNGDTMRLSDLQNKTVINIIDGKNVGNIIDLEISENGTAIGLVVEKYKFLISSFTNKKEIIIKWEEIKKIGKDVILVNIVY